MVQPAGSESCVRVTGRPDERSVDSECRCRVIEPRKLTQPESRPRVDNADHAAISNGHGNSGSAGSQSTAATQQGSPGTWEVLPTSDAKVRMRAPDDRMPGPTVVALTIAGAKNKRSSGRLWASASELGSTG